MIFKVRCAYGSLFENKYFDSWTDVIVFISDLNNENLKCLDVVQITTIKRMAFRDFEVGC